MKKPPFIEEEIYHLYNRGVEKRDIFCSSEDYLRFIHDLFELNDENRVINADHRFSSNQKKERRPRILLVEILIFTLMPNHFHLLLRQKKRGGIVKFMQKLGTGYTMYFNKKYERVGSLFQGSFKAVRIEKEEHFRYLLFYIHSNPLELNYGGLTSIEFLETYRWSSFPDYIGIKNFPSITSRDFLLEIFGSEDKYRQTMEEWLKEEEKWRLEKIKGLILE